MEGGTQPAVADIMQLRDLRSDGFDREQAPSPLLVESEPPSTLFLVTPTCSDIRLAYLRGPCRPFRPWSSAGSRPRRGMLETSSPSSASWWHLRAASILCGSPLSHLVVAMSGFMTSAGGHSLWHSWDERGMTKRHVSAQRGPKYSLQDSAR